MGGVADAAGGAFGAAKGLGGSIINPILGNGGLLGREGDAPQLANVQQGTSVDDVKNAQAGVSGSLDSQQRLLQALQNQNGLDQQNMASSQAQGLAAALARTNSIGAQTSAIGGLQNAANMYQNIAQGNGPNPAQAMLNQATGQNVANQAALMAGQRGAGANVGLLARQAAQQGAATQQQAVGQGATMQANQQINALAGLTGAQQAAGSLGATLTNQQNAANQAYAAQANQVAGQQIAANQAAVQNQLANQNQMQNALAGINSANVNNQAGVNTGNVALSQGNTAAKQQAVGGLFNASGLGVKTATGSAGGGGGAASGARGGLAETGGHVTAETPAQKKVVDSNSYKNDKIPTMLTEDEIVLPLSVTQSDDPVAAAAEFVKQVMAKKQRKMAEGGPVQPLDPSSPAEADDEEMEAPAEGQGMAAPPAANAPAPAAAAPQQPAPAPAPEAQAAPAPEAAPSAPSAKPEVTVEQRAAARNQEDSQFADNAEKSRIRPETYKGLYDKEDTAGKIGLLFGLALSGFGSGLSKQPNAVLHMMDQQIQNDLEAQKNNQGNKLNWVKLAVDNERNKVLNELSQSEITKNSIINAREFFQNKDLHIPLTDIGMLSAYNKMAISAVTDQQNLINKMPPGPDRDRAQASLTKDFIPPIMNRIQQNNAKAAQLEQQVKSTAENLSSSSKSSPVNTDRYQEMVKQGAVSQSKLGYVDPKKGIAPSDAKEVGDALTKVKTNRTNYEDVIEVSNLLAKIKRFGQTPTGLIEEYSKKGGWLADALGTAAKLAGGDLNREREILVDALSQRLTNAGASDATVAKMKAALTPNMFDDATTIKKLNTTINQHFAHNDIEQNSVFDKYQGLVKPMKELKIEYDPNNQRDIVDEKIASRTSGGSAKQQVASEKAAPKEAKEDDDIPGWAKFLGARKPKATAKENK